ncbi:MAG: multicopper oxidase domain-containing protein [Longimicrobiales bacterium]
MLAHCDSSPGDGEVASEAATHAHLTQEGALETGSSHQGVLRGRLVAAMSPITFDGQTFTSRVYNGQYLPPLLRVNPGDSLKLRVVNRLTGDDVTNIHYHGTSVSPRPGMDNIYMHIATADSFDFALYFPTDHERGLYWYHPHPHGESEEQVLGGMSGLMVVDLNHIPTLGSIAGIILLAWGIVRRNPTAVRTRDARDRSLVRGSYVPLGRRRRGDPGIGAGGGSRGSRGARRDREARVLRNLGGWRSLRGRAVAPSPYAGGSAARLQHGRTDRQSCHERIVDLDESAGRRDRPFGDPRRSASPRTDRRRRLRAESLHICLQ